MKKIIAAFAALLFIAAPAAAQLFGDSAAQQKAIADALRSVGGSRSSADALRMTPQDPEGHYLSTFSGIDWAYVGSLTNTLTALSTSGRLLTSGRFTQLNAQPGCLMLYDAATVGAVTVGTTVPRAFACTAAAGNATVEVTPFGMPFQNGIVALCTGTFNANATPGATACPVNLISTPPPVGTFPQSTDIVSWSTTPVTTSFAGLPIATDGMQLVYQASKLAGGLCDIVLDGGYSTSSGPHTFYADSGQAYGVGQVAGPTSTVSPYGCVDNKLTASISYDTTNSRWNLWQFKINSSYRFQTDGYSPPPTGFYMEVTMTNPTPPAGFCPWLAPNWMTNYQHYVQSAGTFWGNTHSYLEWDGPGEACLNGSKATPNTRTPYYPVQTLHWWAPATANILGEQYTHLSKQSPNPSTTTNWFDGLSHRYGTLVNANWMISYFDGVEVARVRKNSRDQETAAWTLKITDGLYDTPTAPTSTVFTTTISDVKVWLCGSNTSCPVN